MKPKITIQPTLEYEKKAQLRAELANLEAGKAELKVLGTADKLDIIIKQNDVIIELLQALQPPT